MKKIVFLCVMLTVVLIISLSFKNYSTPIVEQAVEQGSILVQYKKELVFWEQRIKKDPFSMVARVRYGEAAIAAARASGDESFYVKAEQVIRAGLARRPDSEEAAILLARLLMTSHKFKEAYHIVDTLYSKTNKVTLLAIRGDAALGMGNYARARSDYEQYHSAAPGYSSWTRAAHIASVYGSKDVALEHLKKARKAAQQLGAEPRAWIELRIGIVHLQANELELARRNFKQALLVAPDYYLALEHIAETYELEGDFATARPYLERAVGLNRDPLLVLRLAAIETNTGRVAIGEKLKQEALELARVAYQQSPAHAREYANLLLEVDGDASAALQAARIDWETRPDDLEANYLLARAYYAKGDSQKAQIHLKHALRLGVAPDDYYALAEKVQLAASTTSLKSTAPL